MKQLKGHTQEFINRSKHGRCISSVPQLNGNSIEFSLSTQTRRVIKLPQAKSLQEVNEYKVRDLVMLSTKDLKYQMASRRTEKLMERFVGPYKVKKIILANVVELELSSTIRIHPVVNISKIHRYIGQVEGQRKVELTPVIIEEEEE